MESLTGKDKHVALVYKQERMAFNILEPFQTTRDMELVRCIVLYDCCLGICIGKQEQVTFWIKGQREKAHNPYKEVTDRYRRALDFLILKTE